MKRLDNGNFELTTQEMITVMTAVFGWSEHLKDNNAKADKIGIPSEDLQECVKQQIECERMSEEIWRIANSVA